MIVMLEYLTYLSLPLVYQIPRCIPRGGVRYCDATQAPCNPIEAQTRHIMAMFNVHEAHVRMRSTGGGLQTSNSKVTFGELGSKGMVFRDAQQIVLFTTGTIGTLSTTSMYSHCSLNLPIYYLLQRCQ
jgi:hypothetical protein